jgi:hypothetical protein
LNGRVAVEETAEVRGGIQDKNITMEHKEEIAEIDEA